MVVLKVLVLVGVVVVLGVVVVVVVQLVASSLILPAANGIPESGRMLINRRMTNMKQDHHKLTTNCTLPETNIAPSQKESSLPTIHFQVLLLLVSGRVSRRKNSSHQPTCAIDVE